MKESKPCPDPNDYHEGPQTEKRFFSAMKQILSVPYEELKKRDEAWKTARRKRKQARA